MPKSKEYLSTSSDSDSEAERKPKKKKVEKPQEKQKPKSSATKGPGGEHMFQLSKMRFVTVSEFRGKTMVGIREFYDADGDLKPGKKGISLTLEQWEKLKDQIADVDAAIKDM